MQRNSSSTSDPISVEGGRKKKNAPCPCLTLFLGGVGGVYGPTRSPSPMYHFVVPNAKRQKLIANTASSLRCNLHMPFYYAIYPGTRILGPVVGCWWVGMNDVL
jgi:hypothetical protein